MHASRLPKTNTSFLYYSALAICVLLASLGTSIANIALPAISVVFSARLHDVQLVVVSYLAALTSTTAIVGRLGDIFGHKRMLVIGLIIYGIAALVCGLADNLSVMIWARMGQGIGAAFLISLTTVLARETVEDNRIGRVMGLLGTMSAVGTAVGPSLGGVLIALVGWRSVFLCLLPVTVLALALVVVTLPKHRIVKSKRTVSRAYLYDGRLAVSLLVNFMVAAVMMTTLFVGPFYLGLALGLNDAIIGLVMAVGPVISIISGIPSGALVDRRGASRVIIFGLIMLASGSFALSILPEFFGVFGYILAIAILTPGYQLFQAANNTAVMVRSQAGQRGAVSGLLGLSRNLGLIFGASVMGAVFAAGTGASQVSDASADVIVRGMQITFLIACGMMMLATIATNKSCASEGTG